MLVHCQLYVWRYEIKMKCLQCKEDMTLKHEYYGDIYLCLNPECDEPDTIFSTEAIEYFEILDYKDLDDTMGVYVKVEPEPQRIKAEGIDDAVEKFKTMLEEEETKKEN